MRVKKPDDEPFEIMLIPMIDCMLVIIIFFLVATTMKQREKQLPINLPVSAAALSIEKAPNLFIIGLDRQGRAYISTGDRVEQVDNERLHSRIRETALTNPTQRIRIDGDRDARFEDVVRIIDLCQFEGLHNVGLHTQSDAAK
jgi:biopolymer transport protein ExbD